MFDKPSAEVPSSLGMRDRLRSDGTYFPFNKSLPPYAKLANPSVKIGNLDPRYARGFLMKRFACHASAPWCSENAKLCPVIDKLKLDLYRKAQLNPESMHVEKQALLDN